MENGRAGAISRTFEATIRGIAVLVGADVTYRANQLVETQSRLRQPVTSASQEQAQLRPQETAIFQGLRPQRASRRSPNF